MPPSQPRQSNSLLLVAIAVCIVLIAGVGYSSYSTRTVLEQRIATLEQDLNDQINAVKTNATDIASDVDVVTKRLGVTTTELENSRKFAEKLRADQERAQAQLATTANELATKANATDVAEARQEASTKLAEAQQSADSKIGNVSGEVTKVAANLDATRADLAASRREISDVRTTLSQQIARNSSELSDLRKKGSGTSSNSTSKSRRRAPRWQELATSSFNCAKPTQRRRSMTSSFKSMTASWRKRIAQQTNRFSSWSAVTSYVTNLW